MGPVENLSALTQVLLVDDDASYRKLLLYYLQNAGYEVLEADDGFAALRMVEVHQPRLLIIDIVMPGMEGLETIRLLRRQRTPAKILAVSGVDKAHQYLKLATQFGADAIAEKGRPVSELLDSINTLIPRQ